MWIEGELPACCWYTTYRRVPGTTHPGIGKPGEGGDPDRPQHHTHPRALACKPGWVLRLTRCASCALLLHGCPLRCPCGSSARPPTGRPPPSSLQADRRYAARGQGTGMPGAGQDTLRQHIL